MNIYQKLIEVRKKVQYLKKEHKGHGFNYVASSQTLGAVKIKMDELGLLLKPDVESVNVSDHKTKKGDHNYFTECFMVFTWINAEKPEETIPCKWYGQGLDNGEKGVGKAMTYAEKYFILKFFNIPTDNDDPDSFQEKSNPKTNQKLAQYWINQFKREVLDIDMVEPWKDTYREQIKKMSGPEITKLNNVVNMYVTEQTKEAFSK